MPFVFIVRQQGRCNMMECTCEILAGGGQLGQVKSVDIKISFKGVALFWSTHTQDRLDQSRSAIADARLKSKIVTNSLHTGAT